MKPQVECEKSPNIRALECRVYNLLNLLLVPKRITVQLKAVNYTFEGLKTVVLRNQILILITSVRSFYVLYLTTLAI